MSNSWIKYRKLMFWHRNIATHATKFQIHLTFSNLLKEKKFEGVFFLSAAASLIVVTSWNFYVFYIVKLQNIRTTCWIITFSILLLIFIEIYLFFNNLKNTRKFLKLYNFFFTQLCNTKYKIIRWIVCHNQ